MNHEKVHDCIKEEKKTSDDEKPSYRDCVHRVRQVFERNWKWILLISVGLVVFCVTVNIITSKNPSFSINVFIFPGFILMASCYRSVEVQKWFIYLRHRDFWPYQRSACSSVSPSFCPPPPPPPPPLTPPPPPPNTVAARRRNKLECRKLSWELLSPDLLNMDTIWKKVKKQLPLDGIFDPEHIIREFAVTTSHESLEKKTKRENVLQEKKIFNISIVILHYKLKAVDITACLTSGECRLDPEILKQILAFAPDDQEARSLKKQSKDHPTSLEPAELFYLKVINSLPCYKERLRTVLLKSQLEERIAQIKPHLRIIVAACNELMSSERLTKFIEMLLTMGNIMNGSDTSAFKITFITKLIDYKSTVNKKASVLDYLGKVIINKCPQIAALEEELKHVEQAAKVPLKTLDKDINELKADIEVLEEDVERISHKNVPDAKDAFCCTVELFTMMAKEEVKDVLSLREDVKRNLRHVAQYFGEDINKPVATEKFFGMFATLLRQFQDVLKAHKAHL